MCEQIYLCMRVNNEGGYKNNYRNLLGGMTFVITNELQDMAPVLLLRSLHVCGKNVLRIRVKQKTKCFDGEHETAKNNEEDVAILGRPKTFFLVH